MTRTPWPFAPALVVVLIAAGFVSLLTPTRIRPTTTTAGPKRLTVVTAGSRAGVPREEAPMLQGIDDRAAGTTRNDNGLAMILCWCPPGTFRMGSPLRARTD